MYQPQERVGTPDGEAIVVHAREAGGKRVLVQYPDASRKLVWHTDIERLSAPAAEPEPAASDGLDPTEIVGMKIPAAKDYISELTTRDQLVDAYNAEVDRAPKSRVKVLDAIESQMEALGLSDE